MRYIRVGEENLPAVITGKHAKELLGAVEHVENMLHGDLGVDFRKWVEEGGVGGWIRGMGSEETFS